MSDRRRPSQSVRLGSKPAEAVLEGPAADARQLAERLNQLASRRRELPR